ncbi:MAG: 16S rRNA (uracil(1498)-N(3))-methyltransferase [Moraxellaceae bacterium]|nr:16S rRNA (uracil(1498)-N(3))-methyltransferase [Moraxellaceae bacterium]
MNLLLLRPEDMVAPDEAVLSGRRLKHVQEVHRAAVGEHLRAGLLGGLCGSAEILTLDREHMRLRLLLDAPPPPKLPVTILLALPRPKMLKRILQTVATMGVARLVLLNSYRVEKSFWDSPWLAPDAIHEQLLLGLEQSRDTMLPEVLLEPLFKPFIEDRLPALAHNTRCLVAHPVAEEHCPVALNQPLTLAIGPEGGFIPYEVEKFEAAGFEPVHLGPRILRVETAVTALVARLFV